MKKALITTTINVPIALEAYAKDISLYSPDTSIVIAGDLKTPDTFAFCNKLRADYDVPVYYLGEKEQNAFLEEINAESYREFLPWNCIQRRNVAILFAYHRGAEIIATIDDDNLWGGRDYFGDHGNLGDLESLPIDIVSSHDGWVNVCSHAQTPAGKYFFPRGFSFKSRGEEHDYNATYINKSIRRVVNAGLWTGDPDIDAVTRMAVSPNVTGYSPKRTVALEHGTKCPFNSQNTALHRDVIPAYCLPTGLGRYDDIVAGYIVKRIADHLGDYISFGAPYVNQVRNEHNLYQDLEDEIIGMQLIDKIVDWLYEIPLTRKTYKECTAELIAKFASYKSDGKGHTEFLNSIMSNYRQWLKLFP